MKKTDEEKLMAEKQELNLLIQKGITFDVSRTVFVKRKGIQGLLRRKVKKTETLHYTIQEPTLSTLDRISAEQIELRIDEKIMSSDNGVQEAKRMVKEHGRRLARIVAIAVLGEDYYSQVQRGSGIKYVGDDKALNSLTDVLFFNVKPSKLVQLVIFVNTISNLGDFTNSIRLMSASRTTMPILIEESRKV